MRYRSLNGTIFSINTGPNIHVFVIWSYEFGYSSAMWIDEFYWAIPLIFERLDQSSMTICVKYMLHEESRNVSNWSCVIILRKKRRRGKPRSTRLTICCCCWYRLLNIDFHVQLKQGAYQIYIPIRWCWKKKPSFFDPRFWK